LLASSDAEWRLNDENGKNGHTAGGGAHQMHLCSPFSKYICVSIVQQIARDENGEPVAPPCVPVAYQSGEVV
jgi:hypothetical protein